MEELAFMSQHFKKRKGLISGIPAVPPRVGATADACSVDRTAGTSNAPVVSEGANLAAALTALKVSLKRDIESFLPPTPAASPVHSRAGKRARFDFGTMVSDTSEPRTDVRPKASPVPKTRATVFLSVSNKLKLELQRRPLKDTSDHTLRARKRRHQLSYFAIASAFHRAAHEREIAIPAPPVE